jgi:hypothetical protein
VVLAVLQYVNNSVNICFLLNIGLAFNASLVIYSTLLIIHQMQVRQLPLELDDTGISMDSLNNAIDSLSLVDKGSRMTEKCVRYITALANTLSTICRSALCLSLWRHFDG